MVTELKIKGKSYKTQQTPAGNTVAFSERGKTLSVRPTTEDGTWAIWRNQKHFMGYATLEGSVLVVK